MDAPAFAYVSGEGLEPHLHNEGGPDGAIIDGVRQTGNSEYAPTEITLVVPQLSTTTLNAQSYYWLPEDETAAATNAAPFLGIGLEELDPTDWNGALTLSLSGITGPGNFMRWQEGFNPIIFLNSLDLNQSFELLPGSHTHFNWGFTAPGDYQLEFTISGLHNQDGAQAASASYNFHAVPEPSGALLAIFGALTLLRRKRQS